MTTLAIHGGTPAVDALPAFVHPTIDSGILHQAARVSSFRQSLCSFSGLGLIEEFEAAFAAGPGDAKSPALATNSGTSSLFAAYYGLGLEPGDEVLVPVYTFFASAMPLFRLGCQPVPVDCGEDGNIDPRDLAAKATRRTRAISVTHMWGITCDMDGILALATRQGLPVVEDVSHSHGATLRGRNAGSFGTAAAWSLGAKKLISAGQGGILQTKDADVYERAYLLTRANESASRRGVEATPYAPYAVSGAGLNMRMHPFAAVILTAQLDEFPEQLRQRRETAVFLRNKLSALPGVAVPDISPDADPAWYAVPFFYNPAELDDVPRDDFIAAVQAEGAPDIDAPGSTRPIVDYRAFSGAPPTYALAPASQQTFDPAEFPGSERYHRRVFKLPSFYGEHHLRYAAAYVEAITKVIENVDQLSQRQARRTEANTA